VNETTLDQITAAFVDALKGGQGALVQYQIPLLAAFGLLAFYLHFGPYVMTGSSNIGDAVANLLLFVLKCGIFLWLVVNLVPLADAMFDTFLQWGLAPTGGMFTAESFRKPSLILVTGFRAAGTLKAFVDSFTGWGTLWNWPTILVYQVAYVVIIVAFGFIALHLMITIIEYHLSVLVGMVLLPWAILSPVAFFSEFAIGWTTGGLVRVLVTGAIAGVAVPLFDLVSFRTTAGGDPTFASAVIAGFTSVIFAILAWVVPARAAAIAGRGVSLALHAGTMTAGVGSSVRFAMAGSEVVRGVSSMVRR
jgi:type IV secretion system protein TrbL